MRFCIDSFRPCCDALNPCVTAVRDLRAITCQSPFRCYQNHPVCSSRTINGRRCRILQNRDVLHIIHIHGGKVSFNPIDQNEGPGGTTISRITSTAQRTLAPDQQIQVVPSGAVPPVQKLQAGGQALQSMSYCWKRQACDVLCGDRRDRSGKVFGTLRTVAYHHQFISRHYLLGDRKSTRLNSSHVAISYAVFCLKKKN